VIEGDSLVSYLLPKYSIGSINLAFISYRISEIKCEVRPVSSRKFHAGTSLGEDGSASNARLCFSAEKVGDVEEMEEDTAGKGL
jgi:hypothetical protein